MTTQTEALKLALDWFTCYQDNSMSRNNAEALADEVMTAIKESLAQPEQEPIGVMVSMDVSKDDEPENRIFGRIYEVQEDGDGVTYLAIEESRNFTTPPQRTWVGLTDDEIRHIYICTTGWSISDSDPMLVDFAEAIEAKLKEKNL